MVSNESTSDWSVYLVPSVQYDTIYPIRTVRYNLQHTASAPKSFGLRHRRLTLVDPILRVEAEGEIDLGVELRPVVG